MATKVGITRLRRAAIDLEFAARLVSNEVERLGLLAKHGPIDKADWPRIHDAIRNAEAGMIAVGRQIAALRAQANDD